MSGLLGLAACVAPPPEPPTVDDAAWEALRPVTERCAGCHDGLGQGAALLRPPDWQAFAEVAASLVEEGAMPPWPAAEADVAYANDGSLSEEDREALLSWLSDGAPGPATAAPLAPAPLASLDRVDVAAPMPEAYDPEGEETRCFALGPPPSDAITGVEVVPGDTRLVHHVLASIVSADEPSQLPSALDAADPEPGWACPEFLQGAQVDGLGGWLPGRSPTELPEGVGLALPTGGELVLQGHYVARADGADRSELHLRVEPTVTRRAAELRLSHSSWVPPTVAVEARSEREWKVASPVSRLIAASPLTRDVGAELLAVVPHLHGLGQSVRVSVVQGGEERVLVYIPEWDVDWQLTYTLAEPLFLGPDDELRLGCRFENPTDEDVSFGESADDEMCVARFLVAEP